MPRKTPVPDVPAFDPIEARASELDEAANDGGPHAVGFGRALAELEAEGAIRITEGEFTEVPELEKKPVPDPIPVRALVAQAADHHLVVGMASLANMGEDEFRAKLAVMKQGYERIGIIQRELMTEGVDYGKVPGIAKPFLHQPGAEMLSNLYGFAVRHEAERINRKTGDDPETPPYAYHVRSFVHLGDTSGPVVAEGYGEANPYEDRYRLRFVNPGCPVCGKSNTILTRKTPEALKGKKQCANFGNKDGCGTVFEANDPRLAPATKEPVADIDLYGLAETILQIATKRSFVASIRRATGTSGLFSQDEDSPSVQRQSAETGAGDPNASEPVIENATVGVPVAPGGKTTQVTQVQQQRLKVLAMEKGLNGAKIADLLSRLFGMEVAGTGAAASAAVKTLTADQMGQLLLTMETGTLPDPTAASVEAADPVAYATYPDDTGAK